MSDVYTAADEIVDTRMQLGIAFYLFEHVRIMA